eukprot:8140971-Pyramimonas_sp.AAC.1
MQLGGSPPSLAAVRTLDERLTMSEKRLGFVTFVPFVPPIATSIATRTARQRRSEDPTRDTMRRYRYHWSFRYTIGHLSAISRLDTINRKQESCARRNVKRNPSPQVPNPKSLSGT